MSDISDEQFIYSDDEEMFEGEDGYSSHQDSYAIDIENAFYEAEDLRRSNPAQAVDLFTNVVRMEKERRNGEYQWRFKALEHLVCLRFRLGQTSQMVSEFQELLSYLNHMTRNQCNDSINNIFDTISTTNDRKSSDDAVSTQCMYEIALDALEDKNNRLWFTTALKLANYHFLKGNYSKSPELIKSLHRSLESTSAKDDPNREAYLLQVYSLELQLYQAQGLTSKCREVYMKTRSLSVAVVDPRIMGCIYEAGGKLKMEDERWSEAYDELFEAFRNYQEAGNPRASKCLKYVVLANMIALKDINPFDSCEAQVYKDDPEIQAMMEVRAALENSDARRFEELLNDPRIGLSDDPFMMSHVNTLLKNIRMEVLSKMVVSYARVKLSYLGKELNVSSNEIESMLVQLILDSKIDGQIDQREKILYLHKGLALNESTYSSSTYSSLYSFASKLKAMLNEN